jgi:sec-independent protein translocase protein TatA
MPNLGTTELLLILGIVILVFGANRLPAVGRGLGESIRGFQKAVKDGGDDETDLDLAPVQEEAQD